jgi:hypothetical protein
MKAIANRHPFAVSVFDSGALNVLASVIHQFSQTGRYQVSVRRAGKIVGSTFFEVVESGPTQLDIDLSAVSVSRTTGACDCHQKNVELPSVSAKGYVLFYVSRGTVGYSVLVGEDAPQAKPLFDSENLGAGDLFALSLLEPAQYSMINRHGSAKGEIEVSLDLKIVRNIEELREKTQYVDVSRDTFRPDRVSVTSTQGLVFRIGDHARIVVTKSKSLTPEPRSAVPRRIQPVRPLERKARKTGSTERRRV